MLSEQPSSNAAPIHANRRATVRFVCNTQATCCAATGEEEQRWTAIIRDISASGVALMLKRQFDPWTILDVEFQSADGSIVYTLQTRVVHSTPQRSGVWLLGCVFARELGGDELKALL